MSRRTIAAGLALALLLGAQGARAQSSAADRAAADALYEEAGKLMKAKQFAAACPKLEASSKLDPGIGTSLRLGFCYEQVGLTASAWGAYNDAEAAARKAGDKRADESAKRAKALEPKLSRMALEVAAANQGAEVKRDGRVIDPGAWASAIPVDPGEHEIEVTRAGKKPWKTKVTVDARPGTVTVKIPPLEDAPPEPKGPVAGGVGASEPPPPPPPFWSGRRIAGAAVGGVGVVGLAVGAVLGAVTLSKTSSLKSDGHCNADLTRCDATGLDGRSAALGTAHGSTAALVIGGAALAAGVVVFATAPSSASAPAPASARVTVGPGSVLLQGGF